LTLTIQFPNYTPEKRRPVTDAQLEMLVANTKPDMKRLILFLTSTGMAIGEACHLRRKDIDHPIIEQIKKRIDQSERMEKQFQKYGPNYTSFK